MSFDDFFLHFHSAWACKVSEDWTRKQYTSVFPKNARAKTTAFSLIVTKRKEKDHPKQSNEINIGLFHTNKQNIDTDLCILVFKKDLPSSRYSLFIVSCLSILKFVDIETMYPEGEYLILPVSFKHKLAQFKMLDCSYNLVLHVTREIDVKKVDLDPETVDGLIYKMVKHKGSEYPIDGENEVKINTYYSNYLFVCIVTNNRPYRRCRVDFRYMPSTTMEHICTSTSTFNDFSRDLEPNSMQIACFCIPTDTSKNFLVDMNFDVYK